PANYALFRYIATSSVNNSAHSISELEFFGNVVPAPVPEPSSGLLILIATGSVVGYLRRRRRMKKAN
ncbi:MAG: PEP-CTERM sorting domain-containing protein, partial [Planctomycetales bacterium]